MKVFLLAAAAILICTPAASAQTGANVAVVINENSPASIRIGEHYAAKRGVPPGNVIRIKAPAVESIARIHYVRHIEEPIGAALARHALQDQVLYIVLTKGVPLRIAGTAGPSGTGASVDSELTLLYRRMIGRPVAPTGTVENPYYLGSKPLADAARFTHRAHDIYLVTRLDGFSAEDAIALIDRGAAPGTAGTIALDSRMEPASAVGDRWMSEAAVAVKGVAPERKVVLDETRQPVAPGDPVLGYFSWGSTDRAWTGRVPPVRFAPGALAAMLASNDARTFEAPPAEWQPSAVPAASRGAMFAGSAQALLADLVRAGVTGAAGNVSEPLLQSAVRPQILFPAYLSGFNLAESFYLALPHLSWQAVVVGDPLARPFARQELTAGDLQAPIDPSTGLPSAFMERRLAVLRSTIRGLPREAAIPALASESARARGDRVAAKEALRKAVSLAPEFPQLRLDLALLHEQDDETDDAVRLYREVLERQPRSAVALNNLAYSLATKKHAVEEGLELARKAYALAPSDPTVTDTLGWIEHLAGNTPEAMKLLEAAAQKAPEHAEIRLHAAVVLAEMGATAGAAKHLEAALALDPTLEQREEVAQVRARLARKQDP